MMINRTLSKKLIADFLLGLGLVLLVSGLFIKFQPLQGINLNSSHRENISNINKSVDSEGTELENNIIGFKSLSQPNNNFNIYKLKNTAKEINVHIAQGSTSLEVAHILARKKLLPADEFLKLIYMFGLEKKIKAGNYTFSTAADVSDIFAKIIIGGGE